MQRWGRFSNTIQYHYSPSHTQKKVGKEESLKSKRAFLFLWTKYSWDKKLCTNIGTFAPCYGGLA